MAKIKNVLALLLFLAAGHFVPQYGIILFYEIVDQNATAEEERDSLFPAAWQKTKDQYVLYYNKIKDLL